MVSFVRSDLLQVFFAYCVLIFKTPRKLLTTDYSSYKSTNLTAYPRPPTENKFWYVNCELTIKIMFKGTVSPAERCDFVGVKLEKVRELFQVCRICGKGVVFYNMA